MVKLGMKLKVIFLTLGEPMNKWIKESIKIAKTPSYLDRLSEIYVMQVNPERSLDKDLEKGICKAFKTKNTVDLIKLLLQAPVFPVKDSYLGFLRAREKAIYQNKKTIKRIGDRLYSLGLKRLIQEATRPKETNRQLGSAFRRWLPSLGYPMLEPDNFGEAKGLVILKGSDRVLKAYATQKLGCRLRKGIDILFKKDNVYVIGEAKFLTTPGGEQDRGFDDASSFIKDKSGKAKRIALLDGYVWLESKKGIHNEILKSNLDIFSALLLKKFMKSF